MCQRECDVFGRGDIDRDEPRPLGGKSRKVAAGARCQGDPGNRQRQVLNGLARKLAGILVADYEGGVEILGDSRARGQSTDRAIQDP